MKKWRAKSNQVSSATAIALAFLAAGCGKSSPAPTSPVGGLPNAQVATTPSLTSCPAGQVSFGGPCLSAANFPSLCNYNFGQLVTADGVQACKVNLYFDGYSMSPAYIAPMMQLSFSTSGMFPILNPSNPQGPLAYFPGLGVGLRKGDKLTLKSSGGWSYKAYNSYSALGGFLNFYTPNMTCNDVNVDGIPSGSSSAQLNESLMAGLVGSDGVEVFALGSNGQKAINNDGLLRLGFNTPGAYGGCSTAKITQLSVARCVDSQNLTHVCP